MLLQAVFLAAIAAAASLLVGNLTSTGCADVSGFQKCQNDANEKSNACFAKTGGDVAAQQACACETYILNYNCYATSCWNRVWECEYQSYIISYLLYCPTAKLPVPYFPIPEGAQDACSCNYGQIYQAITDSLAQGTTCIKNNQNSVLKAAACKCCEISGMQSSIWETCPDVDPKLAGLDYVSQAETNLDVSFSECSPMTQVNCASDFRFSLAGVSTYYAPSQFPASGTAKPSNKPGSVTSPASGSVFTYKNGGDKVAYTITAAAFNGKDASGGSSGGSAGTTSTATGAAPTQSKKNAAAESRPRYMIVSVVTLLAAIFVL